MSIENTSAKKSVPRYESKADRKKSLLSKLPDFCSLYIYEFGFKAGKESALAYIYDITAFLTFIVKTVPEFANTEIKDITLEQFSKITLYDINRFLDSLKEQGQGVSARRRKLAAIRGLYGYLEQKKRISVNPALHCTINERDDKKCTEYLTDEETKKFLRYIRYRDIPKDKHHKGQFENERERDYAIAVILLGTGIRVSELVEINIEDIDFAENRILVWKKDSSRPYVYFNERTKDAIFEYLEKREQIDTSEKEEKDAKYRPLFLSSHKTRITARTVENLVCKYAKECGIEKHITCHSLRATFMANVLAKTHNAALVNKALDLKSTDTSLRYCEEITDDGLKKAAKIAF